MSHKKIFTILVVLLFVIIVAAGLYFGGASLMQMLRAHMGS